MKFQCGGCDKFYRLEENKVPTEGISFKCSNCSNKFHIRGDLAFSSDNKNSKICCSNCGKFLHESFTECDQCNLKLNKLSEELRIDNKYYEKLDVNDRGKVYLDNNQPKKRGKAVGICSVGLVVILGTGLGAYYYKENIRAEAPQVSTTVNKLLHIEPAAIEKKVVILKTGSTLFAKKIEKDGIYYKVTGENDMVVEVNQNDVLQISDVKIEK